MEKWGRKGGLGLGGLGRSVVRLGLGVMGLS